jgi:hypothetical protein
MNKFEKKLLVFRQDILLFEYFIKTTNRKIGNNTLNYASLRMGSRLRLSSFFLLFTYNITLSLPCVVRACFAYVSFFIHSKRKTKLSSHTYTAKKNACAQRGEDRCIFFFCPAPLCAMSLFLFLLLRLFFYSKINFPSSLTAA